MKKHELAAGIAALAPLYLETLDEGSKKLDGFMIERLVAWLTFGVEPTAPKAPELRNVVIASTMSNGRTFYSSGVPTNPATPSIGSAKLYTRSEAEAFANERPYAKFDFREINPPVMPPMPTMPYPD